MGEYIEVQEEQEVMQIRSRELQLESVEKLNDIVPVIENIDNVDLNKIELDDILESIDKLNKNISSLKGQITKLSKKLEE